MIELDAATFLVQWAVGGMAGAWFTTRRREVGVGYGWLLRVIFGSLAVAGTVIGLSSDGGTAARVRDAAAVVVSLGIVVALVVSVLRRRGEAGRTFDPRLDLVPALVGVVALVAAGIDAGGNDLVAVLRTVVGALFLGFVSDAMLLGHWYLVQPGLPRRHINEIVAAFLVIWPFEVLVMLLPTGMFSVFTGSVDDGWGGQLGWFWAACAVTTGVLTVVTQRALKERSYSAVMAATGLMYLAILTAFGTDLVARAVLQG
ncbi:MAG: hypothetical protein RIS41_1825 [Actinomycetota bacterium]